MFEHHEICANNKKENNDAFQKLLYMRHMLIVSFRSHLCSVCALFSLIVQYSRSYEHRSQTVNVPFVQQSFTLYTAIIYTTHSPSSQYLHTIYSPMLYLCFKLIYSLNHHLRIACSSFVHMQVGLFLDFIPSFIWVPQFYSQILNIINHRFFLQTTEEVMAIANIDNTKSTKIRHLKNVNMQAVLLTMNHHTHIPSSSNKRCQITLG